MKQEKWNEQWKFWKNRDSFSLVWDIPDIARDITLPHDAMIETPADRDSRNGGNTGFRDGDIYTYLKNLEVSEEAKEHTFFLKFEGIYMNAFVYVNGQLAGKNMFGYTTFLVEISPYLKYGQKNEIRVQVRAGAMTNSRWYSGAGIYRDVYLLCAGKTYIPCDGIKIETEEADDDAAVISITTHLQQKAYEYREYQIEHKIVDSDGKLVTENVSSVIAFGIEESTTRERIYIKNPKLWDEDNPYLYRCITKVYESTSGRRQVIDQEESTFGIRIIQIDTARGLRVNGKVTKLRGACIHHDSGLLGAATYEEVQYRQIKKLKEAGFNAVRMAHHPMAPAMLRACDQLGMFVMDEAFDMWNRCKSDYDYGLYFSEWWRTDVTAMVKKDQNHPSVIMYSIGNEIPEIGTEQGVHICSELYEYIHALDSRRFILASVNGVYVAGDEINQIVQEILHQSGRLSSSDGNVNDFMTAMDQKMDEIVTHEIVTKKLNRVSAQLDLVGYNYMTARYELDKKMAPDRVIVGSETYPPEIARNWKLVKKIPNVIGDFTWSGWDYIGEAGVGIPAYRMGEGGFGAQYPAQLAYCGDFDITGYRRPMSYYREIVFGKRKEPYIAVQNPEKTSEELIKTPWVMSDAVSTWSLAGAEGKTVVVEVYSTGTEVELILNGKSSGKKTAGEEVGFRTLFEVNYEPGELTAVTYENNRELGRYAIESAAGQERQLILNCETKNTLACKSREIFHINIEICDKKGVLVTGADEQIRADLKGDGIIMGFGSGNPKPLNNYQDKITTTYGGRAQLIVRKLSKNDAVYVRVSSVNCNSAEIKL